MPKRRERTTPIQIYLNGDELYILDQKLQSVHQKNRSKFVRELILHGFVYNVDYSHLEEMNILLRSISNNINQIAKRVNTTGSIYEKEISELQAEMEQIWQLQRSIQSRQP